MKKRIFRLTVLVLCVVMMLPILAACGGDSITVITVNGEAVKRSDLMLHIFNTKYALYEENIEAGYMEFEDLYNLDEKTLSSVYTSGVTYGDYIKNTAASSAMTSLLYRTLAAAEGISLTKTEKEKVELEVEEFKASLGGNKAFNTFLTECQTTENAIYRYYSDTLLLEKLKQEFDDYGNHAMTEEEIAEARAYYDANYYSVDYIYWSKRETAVGLLLSEESIAKKYAKAKECLSKLKAGEDFYIMRKEYSEDTYKVLTFCEGTVEEEFWAAASVLRIDNISGVVEDKENDCYYILHRVALTDDQWETYLTNCETANFNSFISEKMTTAECVYKTAYTELEWN